MSTHAVPPPTRGIILLVEEDAETRTLLTSYLKRINYTVMWADTALDAGDQLRRGLDASMVIADATMATAGGVDLVGKLRAAAPLAPVLLMTTGMLPAGSGADGFIAKPFQLVDFGDRVLRMLQEHHTRQLATAPKGAVLN